MMVATSVFFSISLLNCTHMFMPQSFRDPGDPRLVQLFVGFYQPQSFLFTCRQRIGVSFCPSNLRFCAACDYSDEIRSLQ